MVLQHMEAITGTCCSQFNYITARGLLPPAELTVPLLAEAWASQQQPLPRNTRYDTPVVFSDTGVERYGCYRFVMATRWTYIVVAGCRFSYFPIYMFFFIFDTPVPFRPSTTEHWCSQGSCHWAAPISRFSRPQPWHQLTLRDHEYGVTASRAVSAYYTDDRPSRLGFCHTGTLTLWLA